MVLSRALRSLKGALDTVWLELSMHGTCKELHPGKDAEVREYSFNKDGNLSIQMKLP
jgi:hypothetical protein